MTVLPVVIVHWNEPIRCIRTVERIQEQELPVRIEVIDNASSPETLATLRAGLPANVRLVELSTNVGFGGAANIGIRHWLEDGEEECIALAPHDALPGPDCLSLLLSGMSDHPIAGAISAEYGVGHRAAYSFAKSGYLEDWPRGTGYEPTLFPHGTLMLLRRPMLAEVGLFDERYFAYSEEQDLGLRACKAGWECAVVWGAIVENPSRSASSWTTGYLQMRNSILLVRDHSGFLPALVRTAAAVANTIALLLLPGRRPSAWSTGARLRGIVDAWRGRFGPPPPGAGGRHG